MNTTHKTLQPGRLLRDEGHEYLANLQVLTRELDRAMKAVVDQELPSLQDSLDLQQAACAQLSFLAHCVNARAVQDIEDLDLTVAPLDPDLAGEIRETAETLIILNRNYSALLRHSEDTLRLFAELFRCYQGWAQSPHGNKNAPSTWSCEG